MIPRPLVLAVPVVALLAAGCDAGGHEAERALHVVLPQGALAQPDVRSALLARYDAFARAGRVAAGSRFVVTSYSLTGGPPRDVLVIDTPARWGPDAVGRRLAFRRAARDAVADLREDAPVRLPTTARTEAPANARVLALLPGGEGLVEVKAGPERQVELVCDLSSSGTGSACSVAVAQRAYDLGWLPRAACTPGSTFEVVVPGRAFDSTQQAVTITAPRGPCGLALARLLGERQRIERALAPPSLHRGSALVEAVAVAGARLVQRRGDRLLVVASDLREVSVPSRPGATGWNFEASPPSDPSTFAAWIRENGLDPDLSAVQSLLICGFHIARGPRQAPYTPGQARAIEAAMQAAFETMNVVLPPLHASCQDALVWQALAPAPTAGGIDD